MSTNKLYIYKLLVDTCKSTIVQLRYNGLVYPKFTYQIFCSCCINGQFRYQIMFIYVRRKALAKDNKIKRTA